MITESIFALIKTDWTTVSLALISLDAVLLVTTLLSWVSISHTHFTNSLVLVNILYLWAWSSLGSALTFGKNPI